MSSQLRSLLLLAVLLSRTAAEDDIDAYIVSQMEAGGIPGLSARVVVNGSYEVWSASYGSSDPELGRDVSIDDLFIHASISKTVVAVSTMMLVERGLLDLDDDVSDYLDYTVRAPKYPDVPITTRMLMSHVSSISDDYYNKIYPLYAKEGDPDVTMGDFCEMLFSDKSKFQYSGKEPATTYDYSNMGATLVGCVCEKVARAADLISENEVFDDLARSLVFQPLGVGLDGEAGYLYKDITKTVAMPTLTSKAGKVLDRCYYGYPDYADGMWKASTLSYGKMFTMFLNGGVVDGVRLLNESTVDAMRQIQYPDIDAGQGLIYYYMDQGGRTLLGHSGGDLGVATDAFFNPDTGVGFMVYTNGDWDCLICKYSKAMANIETRLLDLYEPSASSVYHHLTAVEETLVTAKMSQSHPSRSSHSKKADVGAAVCSVV